MAEKHELVTAISKGMNTKAESEGHNVVIDEPANMGGTDEGANPLGTLLASLAGCENAIANFVAKEMEFDLQGIDFEIDGEMDPRGMMGEEGVRPYFKKVTVHAKVRTSETEERVRELQKKVDRRCPVFTTLEAADVEMVPEWVKA
ncbi:OsmC family protein [Salimicrobium humidisoli]|uniref:Osmotically inducible protein C n=1 Tax=Salimicrobium humidisoli TaxID=2029857 RepID=A0ABX4HVL4_9BACI|nr:OsmC family protein [Salimicrobium humidisoli]PBB06521.1 osmotically inducible protein C [Salimicrobium humidisoli]